MPNRRSNSFRSQPQKRCCPTNLKSGNAYLIVTEGSRTEPHYFEEFRMQLHLEATEVVILQADGTDPLTVVKHAARKRDERKKEAKGSLILPTFDKTWAVFDTERADTNPKLHEAIQYSKAKKVNVALSNPAFEYWILLHFEYTTSSFANCDKIIDRIENRNYIKPYIKSNIPVIVLLERILDSTQRAKMCRNYHKQHQKLAEQFWNPYTQVDLLLVALNDSTRAHLQIRLE